MDIKQKILETISDLVCDFTYYDRKNCEHLTEQELDDAINNGQITIDEIVHAFRAELEGTYQN